MKNSKSVKWFLSMLIGAALVTFTMTGCGGKDKPAAEDTEKPAAAVEEASDAAKDTKKAEHPEHPE